MKSPLSRRRTSSPTTPGGTIGFRLTEADRRLLSERATALGVSPHELARRYVTELLHPPPAPPKDPADRHGEVLEALQAVFYHLLETRKDLALAVAALLCRAGQLNDADAQAWVRQNYSAACSPSPSP